MNALHTIASDRQTQPVRIAGQRRDSLTGRMVRVVSRHGNDLVMSDAMRIIESLMLDGHRVVMLAYECEVVETAPPVAVEARYRMRVRLDETERLELLSYRRRYPNLSWNQLGKLFGISHKVAQYHCEREARIGRGKGE